MRITLTVLAGPLQGQVADFPGPGSFLIGRGEDAFYRLPEEDACVSRRHVRLEISGSRCRLLDIGASGFQSLNPPWVNGRRVQLDTPLKDGDILELGLSRFRVNFHESPAPLQTACPGCGRNLRYVKNHPEPLPCRTCHPPGEQRIWAKGTTVLAVEDDRLTARLIRASLEKEGLQVLEATNGQDGLALLKRHRVDLVSTDLMMPAMDGFWLIREIRHLKPNPMAGLPIMVLTVNTGEDDLVRCLSAGADDYMTKPLAPKVFIQKLWRLYRHSRG